MPDPQQEFVLQQPPLPPASTAAPAPTPDPLARASTDPLAAQRTDLIQRERAVQAPFMRQFETQRVQPVPQPPRQQQLPNAPKNDISEHINEYLITSTVIGALAGAFTRNPSTNALTAMAGMMKGFQEGNKEKFQQDYKVWEAQSKQAIENNRLELDAYKALLEDRSRNFQEITAGFQMVAAQFKNEAALTVAASHDTVKLTQFYEQLNANAAKNEATVKKLNAQVTMMQGGAMDDETANILAEQLVAGDKSALSNVGRGTQGAANLAKIRNRATEIAKARGMSGADLASMNATFEGQKSGQRALGTRTANLDVIINSAMAAIPQALQASEEVARTGWVPVNRAIQAVERGSSDQALIKFNVANLQIAELWARAMNPTGVMRVADRDLALGILSVATGKEAYKAAIGAVLQAMQREKAAVSTTRAEAQMSPADLDAKIKRDAENLQAFLGGGATAAPTTPPGGAGGWSVKEIP